ncbi:MAG TPA: hypothetical protein VIM98_05920 [Dyella sp.]|uniref:hypothetical protein n=1 Tax=Dyella sp. TaxID=1869338 RepID=UPI002F92B097
MWSNGPPKKPGTNSNSLTSDWDRLGSEKRKENSKLPNRLQKPLNWWGEQQRFASGAEYQESDPKVYRFAAKVLDAAGYEFLQVQRSEGGEKRVAYRFGGLVDDAKKRSFAIEPAFSHRGPTGQEQRSVRAEVAKAKALAEESGQDPSRAAAEVWHGKTFPDLVVRKGDRSRPIDVELKVPKPYGNSAPIQGLKDLFEGNLGGDRFFGKEFAGRNAIAQGQHEQRLLIDLNASNLSKKDALKYFRSAHEEHGGAFKFESLQFIHREDGQLKLSAAYQTKDGFSKAGKIRETDFHPERDRSGPTMAEFFNPGPARRNSSVQPVAPSLPDAVPSLAPRSPDVPVHRASSPPRVQEDASPPTRKRGATTPASQDLLPRQHAPQFAPILPPSHQGTPPSVPGAFPVLQAPSRVPGPDESALKKQRPEAPKLDGRTSAGKLQKASQVKGVQSVANFFGKPGGRGPGPGPGTGGVGV